MDASAKENQKSLRGSPQMECDDPEIVEALWQRGSNEKDATVKDINQYLSDAHRDVSPSSVKFQVELLIIKGCCYFGLCETEAGISCFQEAKSLHTPYFMSRAFQINRNLKKNSWQINKDDGEVTQMYFDEILRQVKKLLRSHESEAISHKFEVNDVFEALSVIRQASYKKRNSEVHDELGKDKAKIVASRAKGTPRKKATDDEENSKEGDMENISSVTNTNYEDEDDYF